MVWHIAGQLLYLGLLIKFPVNLYNLLKWESFPLRADHVRRSQTNRLWKVEQEPAKPKDY